MAGSPLALVSPVAGEGKENIHLLLARRRPVGPAVAGDGQPLPAPGTGQALLNDLLPEQPGEGP